MKEVVEISRYDRKHGVQFEWDPEWNLRAMSTQQGIRVVGDSDGLRGLAAILLTVAQEAVPSGAHVHLDSFFGLSEESGDILIERV